MVTNGRGHWIKQKYTVSGVKDFTRIKHIITEDKVSGFEFFEEHFHIDVTSAKSKSEIIRYLACLTKMTGNTMTSWWFMMPLLLHIRRKRWMTGLVKPV